MHLKSCGTCADYLTTLAACVARRTDGIEAAPRGRQLRSTGQGSLSGCLTSGIDIKDNEALSLPVEDPTNGFCGPSFGKTLLLEESAERF
jgi:hypothetical protein